MYDAIIDRDTCQGRGHEYGPMERAWFTGTPRRVCGQCGMASLDSADDLDHETCEVAA